MGIIFKAIDVGNEEANLVLNIGCNNVGTRIFCWNPINELENLY